MLTAEQANEQTMQASGAMGFDHVYVNNADLNAMLAGERVAGIRFYTGKASEEAREQVIIAAAVYEDGTETGAYSLLDGNSSTSISMEDAKASVQRSFNAAETTIAARFNASDLTGRVMVEGSTGMHVKAANGSLILVAAIEGENGTEDFGVAYMVHAEPCPPGCEENLLIRMN